MFNTTCSSDSSAMGKFDDPFLLPSNDYIPDSLSAAFDFCRYLYFLNPEYRKASQRTIRHFVTDIHLDKGSSAEQKDFLDYLMYTLKLHHTMMEMGDDWACFAAETLVPTKEGVFRISDLEGKTVNVLNADGVYTPAKFSCYGNQELFELTLKDDQKFRVTGNHEWLVKVSTGNVVRRKTVDLKLSHRIPRSFHKHPESDDNRSGKTTNYREFVGIKSIKALNISEPVYCCEEPDTHTFTVGNGVLTSNCYGNAMYRIHFPFKRFLVDERGKYKKYYDLSQFNIGDVKFDLKDMAYEVPDPRNNLETKAKFGFVDIKDKTKESIKLVKIDPRYIDIMFSEISYNKMYVYRFPQRIKSAVKNGNLFEINNIPRKMLQAIQSEKDFMFNTDEIFHFKAPTISGISENDWGLPEPIANFRLFYQIQIYRKIDETVGLDYMLPFRVITPEMGTNTSDYTQKLAMGRWQKEMKKMVEVRRKNKWAMFTLPFPVQYQEFGAGGKDLTPKELLEYQINNLLNAVGYPAELFNMSLQVQQMPNAIRLFENTFWFIHQNFNQFARWVCRRVSQYLGIEDMEPTLERPSFADNIDRQNILLQLGMQGEIPRSAYMPQFGVADPVSARLERMREDNDIQLKGMEEQEALQKRVESRQSLEEQLSSPTGGGGPGGGGGASPMDIEQRAQAKAQEWLGIQSDGDRRKAMEATKAESYNLYSLAKTMMEEMRREGASQGRQAVNEQAAQEAQAGGM